MQDSDWSKYLVSPVLPVEATVDATPAEPEQESLMTPPPPPPAPLTKLERKRNLVNARLRIQAERNKWETQTKTATLKILGPSFWSCCGAKDIAKRRTFELKFQGQMLQVQSSIALWIRSTLVVENIDDPKHTLGRFVLRLTHPDQQDQLLIGFDDDEDRQDWASQFKACAAGFKPSPQAQSALTAAQSSTEEGTEQAGEEDFVHLPQETIESLNMLNEMYEQGVASVEPLMKNRFALIQKGRAIWQHQTDIAKNPNTETKQSIVKDTDVKAVATSEADPALAQSVASATPQQPLPDSATNNKDVILEHLAHLDALVEAGEMTDEQRQKETAIILAQSTKAEATPSLVADSMRNQPGLMPVTSAKEANQSIAKDTDVKPSDASLPDPSLAQGLASVSPQQPLLESATVDGDMIRQRLAQLDAQVEAGVMTNEQRQVETATILAQSTGSEAGSALVAETSEQISKIKTLVKQGLLSDVEGDQLLLVVIAQLQTAQSDEIKLGIAEDYSLAPSSPPVPDHGALLICPFCEVGLLEEATQCDVCEYRLPTDIGILSIVRGLVPNVHREETFHEYRSTTKKRKSSSAARYHKAAEEARERSAKQSAEFFKRIRESNKRHAEVMKRATQTAKRSAAASRTRHTTSNHSTSRKHH